MVNQLAGVLGYLVGILLPSFLVACLWAAASLWAHLIRPTTSAGACGAEGR